MTVVRFCIPVSQRLWPQVHGGATRAVAADDLGLPGFRGMLAAASAAIEDPAVPSIAAIAADLRGGPPRTARAWEAIGPDGRVLGLIGLLRAEGRTGGRYSIPWLVVDPQERRRGVGTRLVGEALSAAAAAGAEVVWAETRSTWPAASAFWARLAAGSPLPPPP